MKRIEFDAFSEELPAPHRYALMFALVFVAYAVRSFALPTHAGLQFATFYPAVMTAFYLGGAGPGVAAIISSAIIAYHFFLPHNSAETFEEAIICTAIFVISAGICAYFVNRLHHYRKSLVNEERLVAKLKLEEASKSLSLAVDGGRLGVWRFHPVDRSVSLSDTCAQHYGLPAGVNSISYGKLLSIIHPAFLDAADKAFNQSITQKADFVFEHKIIWPDGTEHWIYVHGRPVFSEDGTIKQADGITVDVTDRKSAEEKYRSSIATIRAAFSSMDEAIIIGDAQGRVIDCNNAAADFFRLKSHDQVPGTYSEFYSMLDISTLGGEAITNETSPYKNALQGKMQTYELRFQRRDTGATWYGLINASPVYGENEEIVGAAVTASDITARVELQQQMEERVRQRTVELATANQALIEMSHHDALTGLFNRLACNERLLSEFTRMKRTGQSYGILMLDIDLFKGVNDRYGHVVGDEILQLVADALSRNLREYDFVARWGGEEFLVLLPATEFDQACIVAEKLRFAIEAETHPIAGAVTVSVGVAVAAPDDLDEDIAVMTADKGLYEAKEGGRNRVVAKRSVGGFHLFSAR
jgi:diguanylate cyclase (GGDEF)-like protein/PAS domain S-box-containing protein